MRMSRRSCRRCRVPMKWRASRSRAEPEVSCRRPAVRDRDRLDLAQDRGAFATYGLGRDQSRRGEFTQRQHAQRGGQGTSRLAFGIRGGDQRRQGLAAPGRDMRQCRPELLLQRNAGAVAGEREAAFDQATQPPPPGSVAPGTVIAAGTTQRSKSSGRTKPSFSAACFKVMFSARASLPIFTALS
jgi:hypothetical protein